jgi:hypothetical protein
MNEETDWSSIFTLVIWTVFWGDVFVVIFHPWTGLLKNYLWALPVLNIAGIVCGIALVIVMICAKLDNHKKGEEKNE